MGAADVYRGERRGIRCCERQDTITTQTKTKTNSRRLRPARPAPTAAPAAEPPNPYLTIQELATILRKSYSRTHLLVQSGQIASFRLGTRYLVPRRALREMEDTAIEQARDRREELR